MGLQVADPSADLAIQRIAGCLPEFSRDLVVEGDERGHPTGAALAQMVLAGPRQREPDSLPPAPTVDGESIHVPSPSVPGGDQRPDDLPVLLGDQQGGGGVVDEALDVFDPVGRARMPAPGPGPEAQYGRHIRPPAPPYGDSFAAQAPSIARARATGPSLCLNPGKGCL